MQDTSATNFMIRDSRMQKLVAAEKEPITPFISKVRTVCQIVFKRPGGNTRSTMRNPVLSVKKKDN